MATVLEQPRMQTNAPQRTPQPTTRVPRSARAFSGDHVAFFLWVGGALTMTVLLVKDLVLALVY